MSGVLELTVVGASGLKDKELFTKQDPYVVVEYGSQRFRTKTDKDGGTTPAFNSTFHLQLLPGVEEFSAVIWNDNLGRDDVIGSCRVNFRQAFSAGVWDMWHPVYTKSQKQRGSLHLIIKAPGARAPAGYPPSAYPPAPYPTAPYPAPAPYPTPPNPYPPAPGYPAQPQSAYPPPSSSAYPPPSSSAPPPSASPYPPPPPTRPPPLIPRAPPPPTLLPTPLPLPTPSLPAFRPQLTLCWGRWGHWWVQQQHMLAMGMGTGMGITRRPHMDIRPLLLLLMGMGRRLWWCTTMGTTGMGIITTSTSTSARGSLAGARGSLNERCVLWEEPFWVVTRISLRWGIVKGICTTGTFTI
ncbi:hypothetical protein CLOP_g20259 [Closterium sp. NIES-67]|nr:hypothetical protein CLOP_g20259 [Closterium sp. NIES-67]